MISDNLNEKYGLTQHHEVGRSAVGEVEDVAGLMTSFDISTTRTGNPMAVAQIGFPGAVFTTQLRGFDNIAGMEAVADKAKAAVEAIEKEEGIEATAVVRLRLQVQQDQLGNRVLGLKDLAYMGAIPTSEVYEGGKDAGLLTPKTV